MRTLVVAVFVALLAPATASAHATLRSTTPHFGTELSRAPTHDSPALRPARSAAARLGARPRPPRRRPRATGAPRRQIDRRAAPARCQRGAYTVRWHAISADSHVVSGVWTFGVGVPAPAVTSAYGAGGPTRDRASRALALVPRPRRSRSASLGLRLIVLRGLAVPRAARAPHRRRGRRRCARQPACGHRRVLAALGRRIAVAVRHASSTADLSPMAATRFGRAFVVMTLGFALVLALVYLAWLLERVTYLVPALVLSTVLVGRPFALRARRCRRRLVVEDRARRLGAHRRGVALDRRARRARRPRLVRGAVAAAGRVRPLLAARDGARRRRASPRARTCRSCVCRNCRTSGRPATATCCSSSSGWCASRSLWGAFHHFVDRPALARADDGVLSRIGGSLAGESLVGVAVLLAAAVLVDSRPPRQPIRTSDRQSQAPRAAVTLPP